MKAFLGRGAEVPETCRPRMILLSKRTKPEKKMVNSSVFVMPKHSTEYRAIEIQQNHGKA
jgi:hypothetical protein